MPLGIPFRDDVCVRLTFVAEGRSLENEEVGVTAVGDLSLPPPPLAKEGSRLRRVGIFSLFYRGLLK